MKKNSGKGTVDLEKGKIETPDVDALAKSHYAGRTQVKKEDGRRNVPIIEDKIIDPYKGIKSTKKHENSSAHGEALSVETNFDKKAYEELDE